MNSEPRYPKRIGENESKLSTEGMLVRVAKASYRKEEISETLLEHCHDDEVLERLQEMEQLDEWVATLGILPEDIIQIIQYVEAEMNYQSIIHKFKKLIGRSSKTHSQDTEFLNLNRKFDETFDRLLREGDTEMLGILAGIALDINMRQQDKEECCA